MATSVWQNGYISVWANLARDEGKKEADGQGANNGGRRRSSNERNPRSLVTLRKAEGQRRKPLEKSMTETQNPPDCKWVSSERAHLDALNRDGIAALLQQSISLEQGKQIHSHIIRIGMGHDTFLGNLLVSMYGKHGAMDEARMTFDSMHRRDVVSWSAMISAYAKHGHCRMAVQLLQQMQQQGFQPNRVSFLSALRGCDSAAFLVEGKFIHECVIAFGLDTDVVTGTALLNMYGKCGSFDGAFSVFRKMPQLDVVSWTTMIGICVLHCRANEAIRLFREMQETGLTPSKVTFVTVLGACNSREDLAEGRLIHAHAVACEFDLDVIVGTALLNMYGKCGSLEDASSVFNRMPQLNVISWNTMIAIYIQHGHGKKALELFREMQREGTKPDRITFISILDACDSNADLTEGYAIHECIIDCQFQSDFVVGTALINMYGKCGSLKDARSVFDKLHQRDVVSWNAMIGAYTNSGHNKEAIQLFHEMRQKGVKPNKVTYTTVLGACANLTALSEGEMIHSCIINDQLELDTIVETALINMYGKCGALKDATSVFGKMQKRDLATWNAMIAAYAQHGHGAKALELFQWMQQEGVKPDDLTFVSLLSACSHSGMLHEGRNCYLSMIRDYGITPKMEHYSCMIDLLGRAGQLDEAEGLIRKASLSDAELWLTLLGACRIHGDVRRGTHAAEQVSDLNLKDDGTYTLLSWIYASNGRWDDVAKLKTLGETGERLQPQCSLVGIEKTL